MKSIGARLVRVAGLGLMGVPFVLPTTQTAEAGGDREPFVYLPVGDLVAGSGEGLPDETDPDTEAGYVMGERLVVADELGMPTHPGAPAWLVAVGEAMHTSCLMATNAVE